MRERCTGQSTHGKIVSEEQIHLLSSNKEMVMYIFCGMLKDFTVPGLRSYTSFSFDFVTQHASECDFQLFGWFHSGVDILSFPNEFD